MEKNKVKIKIVNSKGDIETLWAVYTGNNKYKLDSSPFVAYGVSWKDIVEAFPDDTGVLEFKRVVEKSGNRTVRVASQDKEIEEDFREKIISMGGSIEGANKKFIAVNIAPTVNFKKIIDFISCSNYDWEYADPTYEEINNIN